MCKKNKLTPIQRCLLVEMMEKFPRSKGWYSTQYLATGTGFAKSSVDKSVSILQKKGLIEINYGYRNGLKTKNINMTCLIDRIEEAKKLARVESVEKTWKKFGFEPCQKFQFSDVLGHSQTVRLVNMYGPNRILAMFSSAFEYIPYCRGFGFDFVSMFLKASAKFSDFVHEGSFVHVEIVSNLQKLFFEELSKRKTGIGFNFKDLEDRSKRLISVKSKEQALTQEQYIDKIKEGKLHDSLTLKILLS